MKRNIISELEDWKNDGNRKPLLLKGIPRSGKTSVLQQFGRDYFSDTAYFNFEETPELQTIFQTNLTPRRILTELGHIRGNPLPLEKHSSSWMKYRSVWKPYSPSNISQTGCTLPAQVP